MLLDELRGYHEGLRWAQHGSAAVRIPPLEREDFLAERAELSDLRIDEYEILRVTFADQRRRARADVSFTWHLDSRGIVHTTVTRQDWERVGKAWWLTGEVRLHGEPMPGVAEPDERGEPQTVPKAEASRAGA
jgi:hypothetical protein